MKKLFAVIAVAGTLALASCGSGDATTSTIDSTAIKDSIAKAQAAIDSAAKAAVDTTVKAVDSAVKKATK